MMPYNLLYYLIFLLLGLNFNITAGLYYFDIIIISFIFYLLLKYRIYISNSENFFIRNIILLLFIPSIISLVYQVFIHDITDLYLIYIPYNLTLLIIYILFVSNTINKTNLNYNIVILLLSIPIIIAILMALVPLVNSIAVSIYHIEQQHPIRFAGIWGKDVNQLGFYSTMFIVVNIFLRKYKKTNLLLSTFLLLLAFFAIILSGMRTGLLIIIILFPVFAILFRKDSWINLRQIFTYILVGTLALFLFFLIFPGYLDLFLSSAERFNIGYLEQDLSGSVHSGHGHMGSMYIKWFNSFTSNNNLFDILLSFDPKWKYPDSFILFFFANNGLLGFLFLLGLLSLIFKKILKTKRYVYFFIYFFSLIISIKGNFICSNTYMFISVIIIYLSNLFYNENKKIQVKT